MGIPPIPPVCACVCARLEAPAAVTLTLGSALQGIPGKAAPT